MENTDSTTNPINDLSSKETQESLGKVLIFVLYYAIIYILKLPYEFFQKATKRLVKLREKGALEIKESKSNWPFLSWYKTYTLEFYFDAVSFLAYVIGFPLVIIAGVITMFDNGEAGIALIFGGLLMCYCVPLATAISRDIFQILLLPFRKWIDWAKKPAQHQDITHTGSIKNN